MKISSKIYGLCLIMSGLFIFSSCNHRKLSEEKNSLSGNDSSSIQYDDFPPLSESKIENLVMESQLLKKEMKLTVYLPKGYQENEKYPVLYLIHGYNGNEDVLVNCHFDNAANKLLDEGKINPVIIVAPQMDNSYGINSAKDPGMIGADPNRMLNLGMYEDYLYKEVVSHVDARYSTVTSREGRYIGGISMGGHIALHLAFAHTDMFSKAGGHMPALFVDEFPYNLDTWLYPNETLRAERDPIYIAQNEDLTEIKIYLDCGKEDSYGFFNGCEKLFNILSEKDVEVQNHLNEGEHNSEYIREQVEEYMLFYAGK